MGFVASRLSDAAYQVWHGLVQHGELLMEKFEEDGDRSSLHEAIKCYQKAAVMSSDGVGDAAHTFGSLANALLTRFELLGQHVDLDSAIAYHQQALMLRPLGDSNRLISLSNFASALLTRFEQLGDSADLDAAIIHHQCALELTPQGHSGRPSLFINLANVLLARFEQMGDRADLDAAIVHYQDALDLTPPGHPLRSGSLDNLASALVTRFRQVGIRKDFDAAISYYHEAFVLRPLGHPDRLVSLNNLAGALLTRFKQTGDFMDLDTAISHHYEAIELTPMNHPNRSSTLISLASALLTRFGQAGNRTDLTSAIKYYQDSLKLTPSNHPDRSMSLNNTASALITRFQQVGDRADLNTSIVYYQEAFKLRPFSHPEHSSSLDNLANALLVRFKHVGDRSDLDAAVVHYWDALALRAPGHPNRSGTLNDIANSLLTRFEQVGDRGDLDSAVACYEEALELRPPGRPDHSISLSNLANALLTRFDEGADCIDLDPAITYHQKALNLRTPGHPLRSGSLNGLANGLLTHFERVGDPVDLHSAIDYHRSALALRIPDHPDRLISLNNLASALLARFEHEGRFEDVDSAIKYHQDALKLTPPGHPDRSSTLLNLASALVSRFQDPGAQNSRNQSISTFDKTDDRRQILNIIREAISVKAGGPPVHRLAAALFWVNLSLGWRHPSAVDAYLTSLQLLNTTLVSSSTLEARHLRLNSAQTSHIHRLALDGAACAISSGLIELALEMLEQGRSILLTQAGRYRTLVDDLDTVRPDLSSEFRTISFQMEKSVLSTNRLDTEGPTLMPEDAVAKYQKLSDRWTKLIGEIRAVDGFQSFLKSIPFHTLRKAASGGPIIVLNISEQRSDAIIIGLDVPPSLIPLPEASPSVLSGLVLDITARGTAPNSAQFAVVLHRIWDIIVWPVVDVLQRDLHLPKGSRIWWCPTGAASHLPLHAAGEYNRRGKLLPNLYISSYTTTLVSLIKSREQATGPRVPRAQLLAVGQPSALGQTDLPSVKIELEFLRSFLPSSTVLEGADATRKAILENMANHEWLHLTCHGHVNQEEPFKSHFSLIDGPLTFREIVERGLPNAEIAFLSACHAAAGNRNRPDEVLHLVAALQFAGFRSVVGTLWEMGDETGGPVTEKFWSIIKKCQEEKGDATQMSAKALHRAVNVLRKGNETTNTHIASAPTTGFATGFELLGPLNARRHPLSASTALQMASAAYDPSTSTVKQAFGRTIQAADEAYFLPADDIEHSRLDQQHRLVCLMLDGLYPAPAEVDRALAPRQDGGRSAVLDVGTGSGIWAIEMAEKFPHADVIGLDIAPVNPFRPVPNNCRFDLGSANDGFARYHNGFDVVHVRLAGFGIAPWTGMLSAAQAVLRPGGVLIVIGGDSRSVYDEDMQLVALKDEADPEFSWWKLIVEKAYNCIIARAPGSGDHLRTFEFLSEMTGWSDVEKKDLYPCLGFWDPTLKDKDALIAKLQQQVFLQNPAAWRPMLLTHGYPIESVDLWISQTQEELTNLTKHYRIKWYVTWAVKD